MMVLASGEEHIPIGTRESSSAAECTATSGHSCDLVVIHRMEGLRRRGANGSGHSTTSRPIGRVEICTFSMAAKYWVGHAAEPGGADQGSQLAPPKSKITMRGGMARRGGADLGPQSSGEARRSALGRRGTFNHRMHTAGDALG